MADKDNIDKALPNVDPEVVLPEEQIVVTEEDKLSEVTPDGAEVIMDEEGGAEINFDPRAEQARSLKIMTKILLNYCQTTLF